VDDGSIVEASLDGQWRYAKHEIVPQGSALFSDLVGSQGLLAQFEARVRDDSVAGERGWSVTPVTPVTTTGPPGFESRTLPHTTAVSRRCAASA